jgi:phage baseplate assembly protein gpV
VSFQVPRSSRRTGGVGQFENTEGARNTENILRTGKVKEVDLEKRLVRVCIGEEGSPGGCIETAWLPVLEVSASSTRGGLSSWDPPRADDVVQIYAPGGELTTGLILSSQFMHKDDAPFGDRAQGYEFGDLGDARDDVWRRLFGDGTLLEYDKGKNLVRVETPGSVKVHACGQVDIKSPFIKLDADAVHVTGKLLLSDKVIGMDKQLQGNGPLDFLGDPIHLNNQGGVFGIAGSLINGFGLTTMAGAIGDFGNFGGLFNGLVQGLGAPMNLNSFLGNNGLLGIIPSDILGAGFNALGVPNVLTPLSTVMGFIENPENLLDPWGMAQFATQVAGAAGLELPINVGGIFDGFEAISSWVSGGEINVNQLVQAAQGSGLLPAQAAQLASTVGGVLTSAQAPPPGGGQAPELTPQNMMSGLRSAMAAITDTQLADTIDTNGIVPTWEMLFHGEVQPGSMIASFVNSGQVNIESLLNVGTPLQRDPNVNTRQPDRRTPEQQQQNPSSGDCQIQFNQPQQQQGGSTEPA